jgi:hypothetical protein
VIRWDQADRYSLMARPLRIEIENGSFRPFEGMAHFRPRGTWARNFAGMRLAELGEAAGGVAYPAVSAAISRFEKRLKVDRDLQRELRAARALLKI